MINWVGIDHCCCYISITLQISHKWRSQSQFSQSLSLFVHSSELQWLPMHRHWHLLLSPNPSPRYLLPVVLSLFSLSSLDLRSGFEVLKSRERWVSFDLHCLHLSFLGVLWCILWYNILFGSASFIYIKKSAHFFFGSV